MIYVESIRSSLYVTMTMKTMKKGCYKYRRCCSSSSRMVSLSLLLLLIAMHTTPCSGSAQRQQNQEEEEDDNEDLTTYDNVSNNRGQERLDRWSRGGLVVTPPHPTTLHYNDHDIITNKTTTTTTTRRRTSSSSSFFSSSADSIAAAAAAVRPIRKKILNDCLILGDCYYNDNNPMLQLLPPSSSSSSSSLAFHRGIHHSHSWVMMATLRGGGTSNNDDDCDDDDGVGGTTTSAKIQSLSQKYGPEFVAAIEQNVKEHKEDCEKSCELYYCAPSDDDDSFDFNQNKTRIRSYSMGATPPEDFAEQFGTFPLDLIKVSEGRPFFDAEEAANVVRDARSEGVDDNEYQSGKYKLGGNFLDKLPQTRAWFNEKLRTTFFPAFAALFPEIVTSTSVLRAHSVSLLKYNVSHPRTDVHIDNGILALTVAMTPVSDYEGGGTFFEHMMTNSDDDNNKNGVIEMDVGHATLRPGSVRHGGHRVTEGTRYILGCFLLLENKVEHVRRLKNRGSHLRRQRNDLDGAAKHFEWALAINPKCTTCLKDWAEILHTQKQFDEAESKIRQALDLLEDKDSDALFTLGVILSDQGRDDEAIEAYRKSVALNAEDAELCHNLGVKLGSKGNTQEEMVMYSKAVATDPKFGGAWLNWGTALAESGNLDDAEAKFVQALACGNEVVTPKAMMNLALVYQKRGEQLAVGGDLDGAKAAAIQASKFADDAKPLLDGLATMFKSGGGANDDISRYVEQYRPQRLMCHRLLGQVYAGMGDLAACETEFRRATTNFPNDGAAWQMLGRILEVQGKTTEAANAAKKLQDLRGNQ